MSLIYLFTNCGNRKLGRIVVSHLIGCLILTSCSDRDDKNMYNEAPIKQSEKRSQPEKREEKPVKSEKSKARSGGQSYSEQDNINELAQVIRLMTETRASGPSISSLIEKQGEFRQYIESLGHRKSFVRMAGALALIESGHTSVPYLIDTLSNSNRIVQLWSCACLAIIGKDALPELQREIALGNPRSRQWAKYAFAGATLDNVPR